MEERPGIIMAGENKSRTGETSPFLISAGWGESLARGAAEFMVKISLIFVDDASV